MLKRSLIYAICLLSLALSTFAQDCKPPAIVANTGKDNMFTPEQEMILGELTFQRQAREYRQVNDPALQKYVDELGARIVKHLPETGLRFQFHIIEYPEANAFNIPGGHVYLTRKLIAFVQNEDELAGVIGHELGHATVHHGAIDMSNAMRKVLGIGSLGDRKDVVEKYNLFIENVMTKRWSSKEGHENAQQLEADRIGLLAMVQAGYDSSAFFTFFDRLTESDGKTGGWFGSVFGGGKPEQKRLREMQQITDKLPPQCKDGRVPNAAEAFLRWQADVVTFRGAARKEELPGLLWKRELSPKLRSDVNRIAFNGDGELLLAQDDFGVTVIDRKAQKALFQIPVEGVRKAMFTPDGKSVVFTTDNLRYERWNITTQKPVEVRELFVRGACEEHELSPDGNHLACVDSSVAINLIDTKTGKKIWEKKDFYKFYGMELYSWYMSGGSEDLSAFFRIEFSPDSKYVLFSRSDRFRFRSYLAMGGTEGTQDTAVAVDTTTLKPVGVDGDIKKIASRAYVFLDSQRIIGMPSIEASEAGVFSFPSGKRLQKFEFGGKTVRRTQHSDYVVLKPLNQTDLGIYDMKRQTLVAGMNKADATIFGNMMAFESATGKILIREIKYNEAAKGFDDTDIATIDLPANSIGNLNAAGISNNFGWLSLSSKNRGGLWNLMTGERKVFVRGFKGTVVGDDGLCVGHFPKLRESAQALALMNSKNEQVVAIREVPERGVQMFGRFVLIRTPLKDAANMPNENKKVNLSVRDESADERSLGGEVKFELKDLIQNNVIWTRDFPKEAPRYSFDEFSGRLILYWSIAGEAGKAKLKENPQLQAKAAALGDKKDDYLLEVIDAYTQKTIGTMLLDTGEGSFDVGSGQSEGDRVVFYDSEDRVLVYSLKDGALTHRFFGKHAAMNPTKNMIAVENFPGEINLYDLETGDSRAKIAFEGKASFVRFNLEGDKLFILSDSQSAYALDLNKTLAPR